MSTRWLSVSVPRCVATVGARGRHGEHQGPCRGHDDDHTPLGHGRAWCHEVRLSVPTLAPGPLRFDVVIARLQRELVDPRTYGRIGYLLLAGLLGVAEFVFLVTAISVGVGLAVTLIGIPILIGCGVRVGRAGRGRAPHHRARSPARRSPTRTGRCRAGGCAGRACAPGWPTRPPGRTSPSCCSSSRSGWSRSSSPWSSSASGIQALTLPLWYWAVPDGVDVGVFTRRPALGGARAGPAGRGGAAARHSRAERARAPLRQLRRGAARLERRPGGDRADDRPARRPLAHHRGRRRRAPPHRARPPRRRPAAPGGARADAAHGREARRGGRTRRPPSWCARRATRPGWR